MIKISKGYDEWKLLRKEEKSVRIEICEGLIAEQLDNCQAVVISTFNGKVSLQRRNGTIYQWYEP